MLTITILGRDMFDESTQQFIKINDQTLCMEHSLVSISKWESKYKKPFLTADKTEEELLYYMQCMVVSPKNVNPSVFLYMSQENVAEIDAYIGDSMTATWFRNERKKPAQRVMTSELIYAQMVILRIPFECQKWHLNRLLTLIKACVEEQTPKKKMSSKDLARQNRELNAARRKKLGTKG